MDDSIRKLFVYICEEEPLNPIGGTLWIKKNNVTDNFELYIFIIPPQWFTDPKPRWVLEKISTLPPHGPLTTIEEIAREIKVKEQLCGLVGGFLEYIPVRGNNEAIKIRELTKAANKAIL